MKKRISIIVLAFLLMGLAGTSLGAEIVRVRYVTYMDAEIYTRAYNYSPKANEAIIFLHGLGGSAQHGDFLHHPENKHMTISFEAPGHGRSESINDMCWDTYVDIVRAVMDDYGIKKAYLVGHSMGADAAMMFAQSHPERVKKIILIDRAYYNMADLEQFNFTRSFMELLEYNPASGLSFEEFYTYLDMAFSNDITNTWDIKKKVLLIAADPSLLQPPPPSPSIAQIVAMIKDNPEMFGLTQEQADSLPDISDEDVQNAIHFIKEKAEEFCAVNHRFDVLHTPHPHAMVMDQSLYSEVRGYVLSYIKHGLK